ncbi:MAG: hypothetical protein NVS4B12_20270 [Ktedonobacteraceae bacterium]
MLGVCVLSLLFALGAGIVAFTRSPGTNTATHTKAPSLISKPEGIVWFYNVRGQDDEVGLRLRALPRLASGIVYVGWLINPYRPDQVVAVGPIVRDSSGQALFQSDTLPMFNTQVQDLRYLFTQISVTTEKAGGQWLRPTGSPLLQGAIDLKARADMTVLFVRSPYTPKQISLLSGLRTQMRELARWSANMIDSQQHNGAGNVRVDLLRFIYLLEGSHGVDVARLHIASQQSVVSIGDGVGLLSANVNCRQSMHTCGYLDMIGSTVQILMTQHLVAQVSAQKVMMTLATMQQLAQNLRQEAISRVALNKLDTPTLHALATLETQTDALLNGSDANGDGSIDAIPGEAATAQLYMYMQQLGAISLM